MAWASLKEAYIFDCSPPKLDEEFQMCRTLSDAVEGPVIRMRKSKTKTYNLRLPILIFWSGVPLVLNKGRASWMSDRLRCSKHFVLLCDYAV